MLGHYARDRGLLPLAQAIAKMTGQTADALRLPDRGRIVPGAAADLVLFAPADIRDAATYAAPTRPAEGIAAVWVNGTLAYAPGGGITAAAGAVLTGPGRA